MHSHERTLIASLGFNDPDKGDPRHDLACQYLATRVCHERIVSLLKYTVSTAKMPDYEFVPRLERPLAKGTGDYRTIIGFLDIELPFALWTPNDPPLKSWNGSMISASCSREYLAIEVKIKPVPIGTILRQLEFYKQFASVSQWVVATAYKLAPCDLATLHQAGINHLRLADGFEAWVKEQELAIDQIETPMF